MGSKKDTESTGNTPNTRDRRCVSYPHSYQACTEEDADSVLETQRKAVCNHGANSDYAEGSYVIDVSDAPARPSFRSTLSQPSQMGNFRHQSLRTAERDRDRDTERERQRDERDREGQERLRNVRPTYISVNIFFILGLQLSDKYDRERLAASSTSTLRNKERDPAPHMTTGSSARGTQGQNGTIATRRAEARDAGRKKAGESSDDWRRGMPAVFLVAKTPAYNRPSCGLFSHTSRRA